MGAKLLHGEYVIWNRLPGPVRRDPRMEIGWQLLDPDQPVLLSFEPHSDNASSWVNPGESASVLPNE